MVNGFERIYRLTQCTPDLQDTQCIDCINELMLGIPTFIGGAKSGKHFGPSCIVRYDTTHFYGPLPEDDDASSTFPTPNLPSPMPSHGKGMQYLNFRALNRIRYINVSMFLNMFKLALEFFWVKCYSLHLFCNSIMLLPLTE